VIYTFHIEGIPGLPGNLGTDEDFIYIFIDRLYRERSRVEKE